MRFPAPGTYFVLNYFYTCYLQTKLLPGANNRVTLYDEAFIKSYGCNEQMLKENFAGIFFAAL